MSFQTIKDVIFANPVIDGDAVAVVDDGRSVTYDQLKREIASLGASLRGMGTQHGDRVALVARNGIEYVISYYAITSIGAIYVPLNWRLHPSELVTLMSDATPAALIASTEFSESVRHAATEVPGLGGRVILIGDAFGAYLSFEDATAGDRELPQVSVKPADGASIVYTSGTTSAPKGVLLTHDNIVFDLANVARYARAVPGDVEIHISPLYHQTSVHTFAHIAAGATVHLLPAWDPLVALQKIEQTRATYLMLAPTMLYELMDHPRRSEFDLSSLKTLVYGAAPITGGRLRESLDIFGPILVQGYGLTEATSHASYLTGPEHLQAEGSIGGGLPGLDVEVVDDDGAAVPPGEVGEIVIRGRSVMSRYWGGEDATADAVVDGWLHSGDLARVDGDGYMYIVDRKKDLVISGGVNIYPHDVENVLAACDGVAEVAVFGVPDAYWGEALMAVVVPREGVTVTGAGLEQHCRSCLGGYQVPKKFVSASSLPRSAAGKVLKRELRQTYSTDGTD